MEVFGYVCVLVDFRFYGFQQNLSKVILIFFDKSVTVFNAIYGQSAWIALIITLLKALVDILKYNHVFLF